MSPFPFRALTFVSRDDSDAPFYEVNHLNDTFEECLTLQAALNAGTPTPPQLYTSWWTHHYTPLRTAAQWLSQPAGLPVLQQAQALLPEVDFWARGTGLFTHVRSSGKLAVFGLSAPLDLTEATGELDFDPYAPDQDALIAVHVSGDRCAWVVRVLIWRLGGAAAN